MKFCPALPAPLQKQIGKIIHFFDRHFPTVRPYLVGGAVRDLLMDRPIEDLDIECFGIAPDAFDRAMQMLGAKGVGKSFFVYKLGPIDLSLPRIERKVGEGHRGFEVAIAHDTKEASQRRDFTMNALMVDLKKEKMIDHWGGLKDIDQGLIRVVDEEKFVEDSLRVLRAMQFSARLKFRIDPRSRDLMRTIVLDDVTPERIFWEFEKMFKAPWLHYGLFAMVDLGIAQRLLGLQIDRKHFLTMARHMQKARKVGDEALYPYYFLYILCSDLKCSPQRLCHAIHTPKNYTKILTFQKRVPRMITDRFLGALALRHPIRQWLGLYADDVVARSRRLGIYEQAFDPGIRPAELLEDGLKGAILGQTLRRRRLAAVRARFGVAA